VGARFEAIGLRNRGVDEQGKQLETVGCKGKTLLTGEKLGEAAVVSRAIVDGERFARYYDVPKSCVGSPGGD